jgi:hypothetical protein
MKPDAGPPAAERPARVPRETQPDKGDHAAWRTPPHGEAVRKRDMPNDLHPPQLLMTRVYVFIQPPRGYPWLQKWRKPR